MFPQRLADSFRPSPPPALPRMRLCPEGTSHNPTMLQFFTWTSKHDGMSWWKHLENEIPAIAEMGFTQAWLPPPQKTMDHDGRGYDAYDLWDLGEFDQKGSIPTRWGCKAELLQATAVARQHGVDIVIDGVLNHKLGGDRIETFPAVPVDPINRLKAIGRPRDIEAWSAFDFSGRGGKHSTFRWNYEHFTGVDWDHKTCTKGIYRIASEKHSGWSQYVDKELGNYDFLLGANIDHSHPDVQKDLLAWGSWILEITGATGFRIDAIKHIDRRFLLKFITTTRQKVPGMFMVGECWCGQLKLLLPYIQAFKGQVSQAAFFDVPLHYNFHRASKYGSGYDLRKILDGTLVKARPGDAVTFVDNHDTVPGRTLESWVGKNFKLQAYAIILLRGAGHPCVFYGDVYPNQEYHDRDVSERLKLLLEARKRFAYGPTKDYFKNRNCIGFVRQGMHEQPGCAVVISNSDPSKNTSQHTICMNVGSRNRHTTYRGFVGDPQEVIIDAGGWGEFVCMPNEVAVWVKN